MIQLVIVLSLISVGPAKGQKPKADPAAEGRAAADRELRDGTATIWFYGLVLSADKGIDRESGLCYHGFGCMVNDDILTRIEAHNVRIQEHIKTNGVPRNSLKRWEGELFALKTSFERRYNEDKSAHLVPGRAAIYSPSGDCSVQLISKGGRVENGRKSFYTILLTSRRGHETPGEYYMYRMDTDVELLWGPPGSPYALVRGREVTSGYRYMAIDLRDGTLLRMEDAQE